MRSLPELSLVAEHRRGHGALYDALAAGRVDVQRLRTAVAAVPPPGRLTGGSFCPWTGPAGAHPGPAALGQGPAPTRTTTAARHGAELIFGDPHSWGTPDVTTVTDTRRYGTVTARAWHRLHPRLTRRAAWTDRSALPILEGTVIRLDVGRLPSGATAKPVWLWWPTGIDHEPGHEPSRDPAMINLLWQAFPRRFDIEHPFRLFKQTLGWTAPKLRDRTPPTGGPG